MTEPNGGATSPVDQSWQGRSVFVTGAGGFVGSWLAHALVERGATVTVILRDEVGQSNFKLLGLRKRVNIVRGSITDYAVVERALNEYEVDTCFHLAAQAIVGAANRSPVPTFVSNIQGTWTVLEACRVSKLIKAVVVASSDKAYGTQPTLPYTEDMPLLGINPYDASKVCTEVIAKSYCETFSVPLAIARCANIYGPGDLNYSRLIPGTIRSALLGNRPIIRSDGSPIRDYLYIDDAIRAYLRLAQQVPASSDALGAAFNFGTEQPISAIDLVTLLLRICDRADLTPDVQGRGKLGDEIDVQYLNSDRAASALGWIASTRLTEGLSQSVMWYRRSIISEPELSSVR
jgi:CDP-glucose 4,6-dehydratase